jgi:predicted amidohydrolase
MATLRIALANLRVAEGPAESVERVVEAIRRAGRERADIVCFPECYVPGYRAPERRLPPPDVGFLERAWSLVADAAAANRTTVVLGTERIGAEGLLATALVIGPDGSSDGFQDKVQLDPSEEGTYAFGSGRRLFQVCGVVFGVVICHEGWRYPETVRWAVRRGARAVFHLQHHPAGPGDSFHDKAIACRAAENNCYFASVNIADPGSPTTSAVARPDGSLLCSQPRGEEGLLVADLDLDAATGLLASRLRSVEG